MAPHRRRGIGVSRRTAADESEEDGYLGVDDDSLSDGTLSSQSADEDDGDAADGCSEITENDPAGHTVDGGRPARTARYRGKDGAGGERKKRALFDAQPPETEIMRNGAEEAEAEAEGRETVPFDQMADSTLQQRETPAERKRREHEEYIQKRNNDPSFVPTRGGFFLHDNRSGSGNGPGNGGGGGRGSKQIRSKPHGLIVDSNVSRKPQPDITASPWRHDLHDSVNQPYMAPPASTVGTNTNSYASKPVPTAPRSSPPNRSFSNTVLIGNVPVVVFLPGMQSPIPFPAVPKKQHTRLPQHRPPLRRDKPVRISLPGQAPRYIFPSTERSFIFIPRALRPNQQAAYRGRGRSGGGGGGGFYSRRASVYSGSAYSHAPTHTPSVSLSMSMSRRSSMGRDVSVNGATPPLGHTMPMARMDSRPVVRLPPQTAAPPPLPAQQQQQQPPPTTVPVPAVVTAAPFFPPQNPTFRENRPHPSIPIHQPRPQKTVSVADIESPAASVSAYQFAQQQQQQQQQEQPFHHQVPSQSQMSMNGYTAEMNVAMGVPMPMAMAMQVPVPVPMGVPMQQMPLYPPQHQHQHQHQHMRHMSHPPPTSATPLSQIPERAIHAPPFQPVPYHQQHHQQQQQGQQAYYGQPYQSSPMYGAPGGGTDYPYSPAGPPAPTAGAGTVAHESNGTVYYYEAPPVGGPGATGVGAGQTAPGQGVIGMGGMLTPPATYYYPPQTGYY